MVSGMSAEAIVALFGACFAPVIAVIGFMWRHMDKQFDAVRAHLERQISAARIESNIRETEVRLTGRIEEQTKRIDALHRDMLGLGERVAIVEARA